MNCVPCLCDRQECEGQYSVVSSVGFSLEILLRQMQANDSSESFGIDIMLQEAFNDTVLDVAWL